MKVNINLKRSITFICSVVTVLALFVGMFSVTAHAEILKDFSLDLKYRLVYSTNEIEYLSVTHNTLNNQSYYEANFKEVIPLDYSMDMEFSATISNIDGSLIVHSGENFDLSISGLYLGLNITGDDHYHWKYTPDSMSVALVNTDGTWTYLYDVNWSYSSGNRNHAIKLSGTAEKDVRKIVFTERTDQYKQTKYHGEIDVGLILGSEIPTSIEVEIETKEVGLLEDINGQINDAINGTPEQNQQAQDAVGGLNDSTDKLGDLGDKMASVQKPVVDSHQISAGSLVPETSLMVLSAPFQALWENNQLLAMLTIVVTLVLVSWVFFGKKG